MPIKSSRIPGFYDQSLQDRLRALGEMSGVDQTILHNLHPDQGLVPTTADLMVENVIGLFNLPLGIGLNFHVNGRDVLVPMAVEEPSVIAGASFMAKLTRESGGFQAATSSPEMIGQLQVLEVPDFTVAIQNLKEKRGQILETANQVDPLIVKLGGGARDLEFRILEETPAGPMLIVHLIYDTRDAMGANAVNTALERLAPTIAELSGGRVHLRILSNLADRRLARATCEIPAEMLAFGNFSGTVVRDGIVEAWAFAAADPYRAATHNKGIMNGVDAVVIATGNDWRAIEAGAHAYAAREGRYSSLSEWSVSESGALRGEIEMPMALGTVGGATRVHPTAKACLALMDVQSSRELAEVVVSVGLAQNLAALRALATEGIQRGHMELHARQIAIAAGATANQVEQLARQLVDEGEITIERAEAFLKQLDT